MELTLIRNDFRELRSYLFNENNIHDWDKIIIIYNLYLFFNHLYILYILLDYLNKDNQSFIEQFKHIYLFFFVLCNLKSSYLYFILNVSKIDKQLGTNFYNNTKNYFI
jgi:hypothetical protein